MINGTRRPQAGSSQEIEDANALRKHIRTFVAGQKEEIGKWATDAQTTASATRARFVPGLHEYRRGILESTGFLKHKTD